MSIVSRPTFGCNRTTVDVSQPREPRRTQATVAGCSVSPVSTTEALNSFREVTGVLVASVTSVLARTISWWKTAKLEAHLVPYSLQYLLDTILDTTITSHTSAVLYFTCCDTLASTSWTPRPVTFSELSTVNSNNLSLLLL